MRKVAMAGALAFATLMWAHDARAADDAAKERREAADATKAEVKQESREARDATKRGAERTGDAAQRQGERATGSAQAGAAEAKHPVFSGKSNYDVEGKVQKVSASSITVQREELPPATLHVSKNTQVELDGEKASIQQLKPGQEVKASFNLRGNSPEAVEIKAEKSAQQQGTGQGAQPPSSQQPSSR